MRTLTCTILFAAIVFWHPNAASCAKDAALDQDRLKEAEHLFARLGYLTGATGSFPNEWSYYATLAFQRVSGLAVTGHLTILDLVVLRHASPIRPQTLGFFHVEVDTSHQILFLVNPNDTVSHILPIATGSGKPFNLGRKAYVARTPVGRFFIQRKIDGWRQSPLGPMYYPNYFKHGFAIHGSPRLPRRALTHGCVVVPLFAARMLSEAIPIGTEVIVY